MCNGKSIFSLVCTVHTCVGSQHEIVYVAMSMDEQMQQPIILEKMIIYYSFCCMIFGFLAKTHARQGENLSASRDTLIWCAQNVPMIGCANGVAANFCTIQTQKCGMIRILSALKNVLYGNECSELNGHRYGSNKKNRSCCACIVADEKMTM